jgi:hypothetical protein
MGQMMMVPSFGDDDDSVEGEAYLGEDDGDGVEGDDEALEIGRAVLAGEFGAEDLDELSGRGFRRGGRRLRRCRQERHALAQGQDDGGGEEFGYASPRRLARIDNRVDRLQDRRARLAPPAVRRRQVYVVDDLIDIVLGGTGKVAGEVSAVYEVPQNTYLKSMTFDGSDSGARFLQIAAGKVILWQGNSENGVACAAFTNAGQTKFSLRGVKILKGTKITLRGKIAADADEITALIHCKVESGSVGCG